MTLSVIAASDHGNDRLLSVRPGDADLSLQVASSVAP
jgi:hypothetical protein